MKIKKKKLDQLVYETIVNRIEHGELLEREHITEQNIANELEISRTPVRKAFDRLVEDEYLENIPNVGVRVKTQKLASSDFQDRLNFFERLVNHYLFDLEKSEIEFDETSLQNIVDEMKDALLYSEDLFEKAEYLFWAELLRYDTNRYTQKILLRTMKECLATNSYIYDILQQSRSLKVDHYEQLTAYLREEEYARARREIRILLNQLKLNVIEMGQIN